MLEAEQGYWSVLSGGFSPWHSTHEWKLSDLSLWIEPTAILGLVRWKGSYFPELEWYPPQKVFEQLFFCIKLSSAEVRWVIVIVVCVCVFFYLSFLMSPSCLLQPQHILCSRQGAGWAIGLQCSVMLFFSTRCGCCQLARGGSLLMNECCEADGMETEMLLTFSQTPVSSFLAPMGWDMPTF